MAWVVVFVAFFLVAFFLFGYMGALGKANRMDRIRGIQRGAVIAFVVALVLTLLIHHVF
jgi:hypothetical protein